MRAVRRMAGPAHVLLQPGDQSLCLPLLCNHRADLSRYVADVGVHGSEIGVQQEYVVDGRSKRGEQGGDLRVDRKQHPLHLRLRSAGFEVSSRAK
jgi:hypothetical protein